MSDLPLDGPLVFGVDDSGKRFATPMERLILLRTLPGLEAVGREGLTYLAHHAVERSFPAGAEIYDPRRPVDAVHFVVEGVVRVWQEGRHLLDSDAPGGIGFHPVLSRSAVGQRAVALVDTVTLEISRSLLFEVMQDDFGFLVNGIRQLSQQLSMLQREMEARGLLGRTEPEETPYPEARLNLVQRLSLVSRGVFETVNLEGMLQLVRLYPELRFEPGDVLWEEGEAATWGLHVVHGVVACTSAERSFRMGPDSVVGVVEAYGELPRSYRAVAETRVVALRADRASFFDVLEDHFDIASGFLSFLSGIVLQLSVRLAEVRENEAVQAG